jgi:nucleoside-diphosphate-sugar epimerase
MRIAVVGATGNIGSRVVAQLSVHPEVDQVVAISRRPAATEAAFVVRRSIDIAADGATGQLAEAFAGCDVVVDVAWLIAPSHAPDVMRATNVDGTARVLAAVGRAGVPALVYASSVGAYSPGPKDRRVGEDWPTGGVAGSLYSRHKAEVERMLDRFELDRPDVRVVRIRPGIVVSGPAAAEQTRYFLGPFVPGRVLRPALRTVVPDLRDLVFQLVHSEDAAAAFVLAALGRVRGAINVAAEPVLSPRTIAEATGGRRIPVPFALVKYGLAAAWRLRLVPADEGWITMAVAVPLMDLGRARAELGWVPRHDAGSALREALDGFAGGRGDDTPVLRPIRSWADGVRGGLRALGRGSGGRI